MKVNCNGPIEQESGWHTCLYGYSPAEDQTWKECCCDCDGEVDPWAVMFKEAHEKTVLSSTLKDEA